MIRAITVLFEFALRVWDFLSSPRRVAQRRREEVDQAIAKHDEAKVNQILDDGLGR